MDSLVPKLNYDVVTVYHPDNRELQRTLEKSREITHLRAFGQDYNLYLEENNNLLLGDNSKLFIANRSTRVEPDYSSEPYPDVKLFHDIKKRAAIAVHTDDKQKVHMDGIIGDEIIIRSLPTRVHEQVLSKHPNVFPITSLPKNISGNFYKPTHHVAIRVKNDNLPNGMESKKSVQNDLDQKSVYKRGILATEANKMTVYPQLLIAIDSISYKKYGQDKETIAKYVAAFWNAVDLRFREMRYPNIRLNIAGLIIPNGWGATPYMENYVNESTLYGSATVNKLGQYLKNRRDIFPKNMYDIIIGVSHLRMIHEGRNNIAINGVAFASGACLQNGSAGLVHDEGGFGGILTAAHEVAHTLAADHDGENNTCRSEDGYLLGTSIRTGINGLHLSHCSIDSMINFLSTSRADCLRNQPDVGRPYQKLLPGKVLSRDQQCKERAQDQRVFSAKDQVHNCLILWCEYGVPSSPRLPLTGVAEGTYCGEGSICLDGQCVIDPTVANYPNAGIPQHQQYVPGNVPSRDDQCNKAVPFSIAAKDQVGNCAVLWCQDLDNKSRYPLRAPPVKGTYCGEGRICLDGQCIIDSAVANYPNAGIPHDQQYVAGNVPSRDDQCNKAVPFSIAAKDQVENCAVLWCQDLDNKSRYPLAAPVKGTYCGEGRVCSDGQCIANPGIYY